MNSENSFFGGWALFAVAALFFISSLDDLWGDPNASEIKALDRAIETRLAESRTALESRTLPRARMLADYAARAKRQKPEHAAVIDELAKAASAENPRLNELERRHQESMKIFKNRSQPSGQILEDLERIYLAADPKTIDASLIDEINTIAALTGNGLAQINLPKDQESVKAGATLVGNPAYGRWQPQTTGGPPVWLWFAPFVLFDDFVGRVNYGGWYYSRPWSYDFDVFRDRYASRNWRNREADRLNRNWDHVSREGTRRGRRPSAYATRRNANAPGSAGRPSATGFGAERQRMARNGGRRVSSYQNSGRRSSYGRGNYPPSNRSRGGYRGFSGK